MYNQQNFASGSQYFVFPPAIKHLLIINIICFIGSWTPVVDVFLSKFALYPVDSPDFRPWQLVTYMFLHADLGHIFFNLFALWMFGQAIENQWGTKRFAIYYFITGVGAGLLQLLVGLIDLNSAPIVGASGAVFGILLAFGMMFPDVEIMLLIPPIPIKAKYFVLIYGILELYSGVTNLDSGIAHFAHLGGMIFGFLLIRYWRKKGIY